MSTPAWLAPAVHALRNAECLLFCAGAGMGVDSGLPDFRGPQGFWRAYPPMERLGLSFQDCSNPASFKGNPAFGWGFFGHRYQLYSRAVPHEGYHVLRRWATQARGGHFVFTSNVDGHFEKAGFDAQRVVECHGSVHFLQPLDRRLSDLIWPAAATLAGLVVSPTTFLAEGALPVCPPEAGRAAGTLARPNICMFDDGGWVYARTGAQTARMDAFVDALPPATRVVVVEVGAGTAIPTVRHTSESMLAQFPHAALLRINPAEPQGPTRTIQIPAGGRDALVALDTAMGQRGIGADLA